jgi:glutaredoxin
MYTVFTREQCVYCIKAKELLALKFIEFEEKVIDKTVSRDYVKARFPEITVLPIILDSDGKLIGGYVELIDHLNPQELV